MKRFAIFFSFLVVDRLTKNLFLGTNYLVKNQLAVLGLFDISIWMVFLLLGIIAFWFIKSKSFGLLLILIGGIGNFIDRLYFGYVIDFIKIYYLPVFNLSDVYVNLGIFIFLLEQSKIIKDDNVSAKSNISG